MALKQLRSRWRCALLARGDRGAASTPLTARRARAPLPLAPARATARNSCRVCVSAFLIFQPSAFSCCLRNVLLGKCLSFLPPLDKSNARRSFSTPCISAYKRRVISCFRRTVDVFPMPCSLPLRRGRRPRAAALPLEDAAFIEALEAAPPGANARSGTRAAAPQPRRARATQGREELAVAPRLDQPTLARLVKVGASISEPIVDHREQIRLFAAADDRARRRHHSRTRQ